jgi:hypothetical protein
MFVYWIPPNVIAGTTIGLTIRPSGSARLHDTPARSSFDSHSCSAARIACVGGHENPRGIPLLCASVWREGLRETRACLVFDFLPRFAVFDLFESFERFEAFAFLLVFAALVFLAVADFFLTVTFDFAGAALA